MTVPLELVDVSAGYDGREVVSAVSLALEAGEILAVFGANGAGKSTILRAIMRVATVFKGSIDVLGASVHGLKPHQVSGLGIGIVLQGNAVFPSLSVRENLLAAARRREIMADDRLRQAVGTFPELESMLDKTASLLSGGERQLVAVARALVDDPPVLLLDEPGAGLAPGLLQRILERLGHQAHDKGKAILLVEQHVASTLPFADRVAVMKEGQIVFLGPATAVDLPALARLMLTGTRPDASEVTVRQ